MTPTLRHHLPHGIELSCHVSGPPGRPVLLFLRGFPEGAFAWDALLSHFAAPEHGAYRCVAPNLRGFADSSAPSEVSAYRAKHLMQDVLALIDAEAGDQPLAALVAHDWGGALAWNLANAHPQRMSRLAILNAPHPGLFWRALREDPAQQAASAYMNFLIRADAEALLSQDDFKKLWSFAFEEVSARGPSCAWLDANMRQHYRRVWSQGLTGGLNYYRASPLRPATPDDPAAMGVEGDEEHARQHQDEQYPLPGEASHARPSVDPSGVRISPRHPRRTRCATHRCSRGRDRIRGRRSRGAPGRC